MAKTNPKDLAVTPVALPEPEPVRTIKLTALYGYMVDLSVNAPYEHNVATPVDVVTPFMQSQIDAGKVLMEVS